ncbi:uncharacterized protein VTP21DRAFT_11197 [Calcarisporiella thermophila]|uniref:uncharacterized protein n=1 Tax=Calcarisporiella thermophila TaxID=911321 RepID=UPI0037427738
MPCVSWGQKSPHRLAVFRWFPISKTSTKRFQDFVYKRGRREDDAWLCITSVPYAFLSSHIPPLNLPPYLSLPLYRPWSILYPVLLSFRSSVKFVDPRSPTHSPLPPHTRGRREEGFPPFLTFFSRIGSLLVLPYYYILQSSIPKSSISFVFIYSPSLYFPIFIPTYLNFYFNLFITYGVFLPMGFIFRNNAIISSRLVLTMSYQMAKDDWPLSNITWLKMNITKIVY